MSAVSPHSAGEVSTSVNTTEELSGSGSSVGGNLARGVNTTAMETGDLAFVKALAGYFTLEKDSVIAEDDTETLLTNEARLANPFPGPGRWRRNNIDPAPLTQKEWHINELTGNNNNDGKTAGTALRTFSEWQRRVGCTGDLCTPLKPDGGVLRIFLDSDITDSDATQVTFNNYLADNSDAIIIGKNKDLASNITITAVQAKNRAANIPLAISGVVPGGWASYIGKMIYVTNGPGVGSRAVVEVDLGGNKAQISDWVQGEPITGLFPGTPPVAGNKFKIVDFVRVAFGPMAVGSTGEPSIGPNDRPPTLTIWQVHCYKGTPLPANMPGSPFTIGRVADSICENGVWVNAPGRNSESTNVCYQLGIDVNPGSILFINSGAFVSLPGTSQDGSLHLFQGSQAQVMGDVGFIGNAVDAFPRILNEEGLVFLGPVNFWNGAECITDLGKIISSEADQFTGEISFVPLWGKNNANIMFFSINEAAGNNLTMFGFAFAPDTVPLPSLEMGGGPGGAVAFIGDGNDTDGYAWNRATASFIAPSRPITWNRFEQDVVAGAPPGFQNFIFADLFFEIRCAEAVCPNLNNLIGRRVINVF